MHVFLALTLLASRPPVADGAAEGRDFVRHLSNAEWATAEAMLDQKMSGALGGGKLAALWAQVTGKLGDFQEIDAITVDEVQGYRRALVQCSFSKDRAGLRVVVDKAGKVAGFFIEPVPGSGPPFASAPYVDTSRFTEAKVTVGPEKLEGFLVVPKGVERFPIVVMLSGSGPNDADESLPPIKVFRDLAEGLGTRGIASLRFEKRTHKHLPVTTVKEEYLDDAAAALEQAKAVPGVTKVLLLGHSLGARLAPRIAQGNATVAGLVLLAGPTWPMTKTMVQQLEYQKAKGFGGDKLEALLTEVREEAKRIDDPKLEPGTKLSHGTTGAYYLDLRAYDPVATAAKLSLPMFLAWGDKDLKVIPDDWAGWKAKLGEKPSLTYRTYPGLQHLFTPVGTPEVGHVAKDVVEELASWCAKVAAPASAPKRQ